MKGRHLKSISVTLEALTLAPSLGLTAFDAAAPPSSLKIGLAWFVPGVMLAVVYLFVAYRGCAGKVGVVDSDGYWHLQER
jgi:hypothetical protein